MGNFYTNVTLIDVELEQVRAVLAEPAFLAAGENAVVVFASVDEDAPEEGTAPLLSAAFGCRALAVSVHDDDILAFMVFDRGELVVNGAVPDPALVFGDEFGEMLAEMGKQFPPVDAEAVVGALGRGDVEAVRVVLTDDFVFATERHAALCSALGLPTFGAGWGYRYLQSSPEHFKGPELVAVGG